jgi:hypothetical protein
MKQFSEKKIVIYILCLTNEKMMTESQWYNCFTRNGGNAIPKHAGPEAEGTNPATGLTMLWAHKPFGGNFNHWQVSRKEAGQRLGYVRPERVNKWPNSMTDI